MDEIETNIKDLSDLTDRLADVREETLRYSQLATAQENLKHLFTVPETVVNTESAIVEGKLLDAHKALSELEQSRDDLVSLLIAKKQQNSKLCLNDFFLISAFRVAQAATEAIFFSGQRSSQRILFAGVRLVFEIRKAIEICLETNAQHREKRSQSHRDCSACD